MEGLRRFLERRCAVGGPQRAREYLEVYLERKMILILSELLATGTNSSV